MNWENSGLEDLIGKYILKVRVGDDIICFYCRTGDIKNQNWKWEVIAYQVEGDCCSTSWISDLYNFSNLIDEEVTHIESPDIINTDINDGRCRQESDSAYGYLICTAKGKAELDFRCSSNGYYGGWISKVDTGQNNEFYSHLFEVKNNWKND